MSTFDARAVGRGALAGLLVIVPADRAARGPRPGDRRLRQQRLGAALRDRCCSSPTSSPVSVAGRRAPRRTALERPARGRRRARALAPAAGAHLGRAQRVAGPLHRPGPGVHRRPALRLTPVRGRLRADRRDHRRAVGAGRRRVCPDGRAADHRAPPASGLSERAERRSRWSAIATVSATASAVPGARFGQELRALEHVRAVQRVGLNATAHRGFAAVAATPVAQPDVMPAWRCAETCAAPSAVG